jgi:hypothetical protein
MVLPDWRQSGTLEARVCGRQGFGLGAGEPAVRKRTWTGRAQSSGTIVQISSQGGWRAPGGSVMRLHREQLAVALSGGRDQDQPLARRQLDHVSGVCH